jgi:hypothetical protein
VVNWFPFKRRRKPLAVPRLRSRSEADALPKVDLGELTPDLETFLGRASYLQLVIFENLGVAVSTAPNAESKDVLGRVAAISLTKQRGLTAEIEKLGLEPGTVMQPFAASIDDFRASTRGEDWFETLVTCHITAGFLDEFFVRLAEGLPTDVATRIKNVLASDSGSTALAQEIREAIDADPKLASRLAMWGRRLLGDTMLVARRSLVASANHDSDEARIEPVFTELIAAHTRRMDALGLTA